MARRGRVVSVAAHLDVAIAAVEGSVAGARGSVGSPEDAVVLFERAERLRRLAEVCRVDAIGDVETSRVHREHGHLSAHRMARNVGRTSSGDAARADKIRRMLERCELINTVWRDGGFSVDQAGVLGRAFANPRVRGAFVDSQKWFVGLADRPFKVFERRVADWVRLADQDGPEPRPDPGHVNRDFTLVQDHFSQQWTHRGSCGPLQGAKLDQIFAAYFEAETLADWETAREQHGDNTCQDHLPRTAAQRRADALEQIFSDAVHNPAKSVTVDTVHNVVWSAETLEEMMRRYTGAAPTPIDVDQHVCHSLDGHRLDPTGAFADFLVSKWRRVVRNAAGVTIDMSRNQRFYTGLARLGVQLANDSCYWHGCDVPVTRCQIDHLRPAARGGLTEQHNGLPACQTHNRLKERGFTVTRQPDGSITITTPHGTIVAS